MADKLVEGVNADMRGGVLRARSNSSNQIDSSQIPSTVDFVTGLQGPIDAGYKELIMAMRGQQKPIDVYTDLEAAAGLPGQRQTAATLREEIGGIEDTIKRVEPTIAATTRESMVTEGQRQSMSVAQKKPLLERLGELATGLGRVEAGIAAGMADLNTKVSLFLQGQEQELEPIKLGIQAMTDRASRLTAAFGIDAQNKFEAYLANVRRGWELDDAEREEAFSLLESENTYTKTLQSAAASAGISLTGNESNADILRLIGDAAARELEEERKKETPPFTWPGQGETGGSDWEEVSSGSGGTDLNKYISGGGSW